MKIIMIRKKKKLYKLPRIMSIGPSLLDGKEEEEEEEEEEVSLLEEVKEGIGRSSCSHSDHQATDCEALC